MSGSRINSFDSDMFRVIGAPPAPSGGVTSWNGQTGDVVGTLASIFAYGLAHTPDTSNVLGMLTGNVRFATAVHEDGWLPGIGIFEKYDVDDDARTGVWFARRFWDNGLARNTGTFLEEQMYNPAFTPGTLPDGITWRDAHGALTNTATETGTVGLAPDEMWQRNYECQNFFFNLPLSIPDLGSGGAQQITLSDVLFRHGPVSNNLAEVRRLNGWGQQANFIQLQNHGIEPGFSACYANGDLGNLAGDGSGFVVNFSNASNFGSSNIVGGFTAAMDDSTPLSWHTGIWSYDSTLSPSGLAEVATFTRKDVAFIGGFFDWDQVNHRLYISSTNAPDKSGLLGLVNVQAEGGDGESLWLSANAASIRNKVIADRSRGTRAVPTQVLAGDLIFDWLSRGYDSAAYKSSIEFGSVVPSDGSPGAGNVPQIFFVSGEPTGGNTSTGPTDWALGVENTRNVFLGEPVIATNATGGFPYLAGAFGAPTGVPVRDVGDAQAQNRIPVFMDYAAGKLWAYFSGLAGWMAAPFGYATTSLKFAVNSAAAVTGNVGMADSKAPVAAATQYLPGYVMRPGTAVAIRINVTTNTCTANTAIKIYKNGAATGLSLAITAGVTGISANTGSVTFNGTTDVFDCVYEAGLAPGGNLQATAVVAYQGAQ